MELPFNIDLTGKVAVVTGAGGVICSYMAEVIAMTGAKVALLDINIESINKVATKINDNGGLAIALYCDVLDEKSLEKAHEDILDTFGKCNILLNGAGGNHPKATTSNEVFLPGQLGNEKTFFDIEKNDFNFVFDLNFIGTLLPTQEFSKDMIDGSGNTIINIASVNTYLPLSKIPAYSAAKEAVGNFTKWLAYYFSGVGIRVNAIAPGFLETHQTKALFYEEDGVTPTERLNKIITATPMKRLGEPHELAGALLFLLSSSASSFITGTIIPVDGGYTAYSGV